MFFCVRQIDDTIKCEKFLMEADISSQAVGLATNTDFSLLKLFLRADIIVKSVMLLLIACSIYSWAIIIEKIRLFKKINISTEEFQDKFWKSKSAENFYNNIPKNIDDPLAQIFKASMEAALKTRSKSQLNERLSNMLQINIEKQMEKIEKSYTFLATVGSTAPFIGLFGTVWGIMNSFQSIAISRNTSLAIVAPGIAEALFATALGLLAAIPAVVAYNKFSNDSKKYLQKLENFSKDFYQLFKMAFKFKRSLREPMSEINVTPFVDVMLVLLIIFMVTAPLLTVGVQVDLPESSADSLPEEQEPLTLTINSKGEIYIQESKVEFDKIIAKILAVSKNRTDTRIYVEEISQLTMVEC